MTDGLSLQMKIRFKNDKCALLVTYSQLPLDIVNSEEACKEATMGKKYRINYLKNLTKIDRN